MSREPQRDLKKLLRRVQRLGCTVSATKNGYIIRSAVGSVTVHRTSSDANAVRQTIRDLRRIGVNLHE